MISLIVAKDKNNAIGRDNQLLCKLKDDMANFVKITTGKVVVMGRKTFDSIGAKPLKDRKNVVLSNSVPPHVGDELGIVIVDDIDSIIILSQLRPSLEFIVIGGSEIYKQFLPYASRIYLTEIQAVFPDADAFFPELNMNEWQRTDGEKFYQFFQESDERNDYAFEFKVLERKIK